MASLVDRTKQTARKSTGGTAAGAAAAATAGVAAAGAAATGAAAGTAATAWAPKAGAGAAALMRLWHQRGRAALDESQKTLERTRRTHFPIPNVRSPSVRCRSAKRSDGQSKIESVTCRRKLDTYVLPANRRCAMSNGKRSDGQSKIESATCRRKLDT